MALPVAHSVVTAIRVSNGEPSARTGGQECLDVLLVTAEGGRKKMANARAPIWTVGPSRPSASPVPIASTPPKNFTGIRMSGGGGCLSRSIASTSGMPLPFAPGANFRTSQAGGQPSGDGRNADDKREASNLLVVRPIDDRAPEAIGPLEDRAKIGSDKAGSPTHRKSQER
jgi:hypothetical protein